MKTQLLACPALARLSKFAAADDVQPVRRCTQLPSSTVAARTKLSASGSVQPPCWVGARGFGGHWLRRGGEDATGVDCGSVVVILRRAHEAAAFRRNARAVVGGGLGVEVWRALISAAKRGELARGVSGVC
eukprot:171111-Pleurochrysis_carterae.AAC.3